MTDSTYDMIHTLQHIDKSYNKSNDKSYNKSRDKSSKLKQTSSQETICRLLKKHIPNFYDNIYIPFKFFNKGKWQVDKILNDNKDVLYYNESYLMVKDLNNFSDIFKEYIRMVKINFDTKNNFFLFLQKWDTMTNNKSYLKSLIVGKKYNIFSPAHIADIYQENCKLFSGEDESVIVISIKNKTEQYLDKQLKASRRIIEKFKKRYQRIINSYVYEYPISNVQMSYQKNLINNVIKEILSTAKKLIKLHIYAIHPIIYDIIDYFLPLDDINQFESNNRKLIVV